MDDLLKVGEIVITPTGAIGVVKKHIYGSRGDLFRYLVHYLNSEKDDCVRLLPEHLKRIGLIIDEERRTYSQRETIHPGI